MDQVDNKLCRACLITKDSFTHYLFEDVSAETYEFCTSIQPNEEDTLPRALCENCYELVTKLADFKRTCIESQNTLLNCRTIKAEEIEPESQEVDMQHSLGLGIKTENFIKQEEISDSHEQLALGNISEDSTILTEYKTSKKKRKRKKHKNSNGHLENEENPLINSCDICGKQFKHCKRMETHRLGHFKIDPEEIYRQCLKCSKTFGTVGGLRRHQETVHASVRLSSCVCKRCGRVYASKYSLQTHEKTHDAKSREVVCHVCGKSVRCSAVLRAHLETHNTDREREHTCEHCGKKFFTKRILLSHIRRIHTGIRFICGVCNFPFSDKHNLISHLLIHDGIKQYKCDICNNSFRTNASLVEHKRIHSGERPFSCSFCPKSFLSKRRLIDHHKTHTGEKPYRCGLCEQRFAQRGTLKRHMRVHDSTKAPLLVA
ncbi:zinc-finger double domain-containing protein [Phthorimaea operculella]|nr:zinc-finger double domain-containing protein [Phthorimaea operculella]